MPLKKKPNETKAIKGYLHDVKAKVLDREIVGSEFELKSRYCIHFGTNTHGKGMNLLYPNYGINSVTAVLLQE